MKLADYEDAPLMVAHLIERIMLIEPKNLTDKEIVDKAVTLAQFTIDAIGARDEQPMPYCVLDPESVQSAAEETL
jgi:hypothetical protein